MKKIIWYLVLVVVGLSFNPTTTDAQDSTKVTKKQPWGMGFGLMVGISTMRFQDFPGNIFYTTPNLNAGWLNFFCI